MRRNQPIPETTTTFYAGNTDPFLSRSGSPFVLGNTQPETWWQRVGRVIHLFLITVVRKLNRLLTFCVTILLLLLFTRFLLHFFGITASLFTQWIMQLSGPFVQPFNGMLPMIPYGGYHIDVSTLVAIVIYCVLLKLVTSFLTMLVA